MHESAWVYQRPEQVEAVGEEQASWYVGWRDPNGKNCKKSFGPGPKGKKKAEEHSRTIEAELLVDHYRERSQKTWDDFVEEYLAHAEATLERGSVLEIKNALSHFKAIIGIKYLCHFGNRHLDQYVSIRSKQPGRKSPFISPATVNKELRCIKAAVRKAKRWGLITEDFDVQFVREPGKAVTFVSEEHFQAIYAACDVAKFPKGLRNVTTGQWWRGVLVHALMTGWRIGSILKLHRDDVDLTAGTVVSRHEDNKGKRDLIIKLHDVAIEHIRPLLTEFTPEVFWWPHCERTLYRAYHKIQKQAGVRLPCHQEHDHNDFCHAYGFHDLRRAFATLNVDRLSQDELQASMQHVSPETTKRYVKLGKQIKDVTSKQFVPTLQGAQKEQA